MIEVKLQDIVNNIEIFSDLSIKNFPAKTSFLIARILDKITKEYNLFQETRDNLIKKYGDHDAKGELIVDKDNNVNLSAANTIAFNNEINELMNVTITIDSEKIGLSAFGDADFTPAEMYLLTPFIDENK